MYTHTYTIQSLLSIRQCRGRAFSRRSVQRSKAFTGPKTTLFILLTTSSPAAPPPTTPIKLFTLTACLPISTCVCVCMCVRTAYGHAVTQLIPLILLKLLLWGGALPPTFDLERIDSSPGLWGRSPLTSEVAQSKPANHRSL